jgi:signal transduction histidine kinase
MTSDTYPPEDVTNNIPEILPRLREIASLVTHAAQAESIEIVLERIARVSAELVHAHYGALGIPDGQGGLRYFKVTGITPEQIRQIDHPPIGKGLLGVIMNEEETLRLEHMRDDPRSIGFPSGHPDMESLLGVPVMMGDQLYGMLYLTDRTDGQPFTEQDQWLIEVMASFAAQAIASSNLQDERSRFAMVEERERISMELHDGVIQSIYAIGMHIDLINSGLQDKQLTQELGTVINGLNTVIDDIRRYILDLRTVYGSQNSLKQYVEDLITRLHIPEKLHVDIKVPDNQPVPLPPATFEAVCQIINEALSNVVRHANATQVVITGGLHGNMYEVTIQDNGMGFDRSSAEHKDGLGLPNIQQRARLHGGHVEIDSTPGAGTRLTITIFTRPF